MKNFLLQQCFAHRTTLLEHMVQMWYSVPAHKVPEQRNMHPLCRRALHNALNVHGSGA